MAKRSRAEIEKLMAELEDELNSYEDDDEEVWVESDGVKFRLTGAKAKSFLKKHSKHWEDEDVEELVEELEEVKPTRAPRKTAAKKTAAPKKVEKVTEEELEELEDELEEDDQPAKPRHFWE